MKSKSTNKNQYSRMVEALEEHPDIAKGFARFDAGPFWESLAVDLNSLGPPLKDTASWKKVNKAFFFVVEHVEHSQHFHLNSQGMVRLEIKLEKKTVEQPQGTTKYGGRSVQAH